MADVAVGGGYRAPEEQKLSPREERFERARRTTGLFAAPIVFVVMLLLPLDLEGAQQTLAAIFLLVIVLWITEAIPIPVAAVLGVVLAVLLGVAPSDSIFPLFSDGTIFLFLGGFIIAQAMMVHGLDRRFAFRVLSIPGIAGSTYRTIVAFGAIAAALSAFISNTATTAMLFPIGIGIMNTLAGLVDEQSDEDTDRTRLRFGTALMLMIAYGASVGGLATPIGSPPNLIGREFIEDQLGQTITFFDWVLTALPIVLVMFVVLCIVLIALNRPEVRHITGAEEYVSEERGKLGKIDAGERNTLIAFGVAVTLWILPGIVGLVAGDTSDVYVTVTERLPEEVVAIIAASLLFVLPVSWSERRFTLTWSDASKIDWGTILLFGSGIVLGTLLDETGLAGVVGKGVANSLGVSSLLVITAIAVIIAIVVSETASNTASVAIIVPIVLPIASAANLGEQALIPALAAVFGASYGFMLPVSTPPNAIVYGSGMVPLTRMIRSGFVFDVIGFFLIVGGVTVMAKIVGLV